MKITKYKYILDYNVNLYYHRLTGHLPALCIPRSRGLRLAGHYAPNPSVNNTSQVSLLQINNIRPATLAPPPSPIFTPHSEPVGGVPVKNFTCVCSK